MKFKKRNILSIISFIIAMVLIFLIFKIDMLPVKYSVLVSILLLFIQAIFFGIALLKQIGITRSKISTIINYYVTTVLAQWYGVFNIISGEAKPFWEKAKSTR